MQVVDETQAHCKGVHPHDGDQESQEWVLKSTLLVALLNGEFTTLTEGGENKLKTKESMASAACTCYHVLCVIIVPSEKFLNPQ